MLINAIGSLTGMTHFSKVGPNLVDGEYGSAGANLAEGTLRMAAFTVAAVVAGLCVVI